MPMILGEKVWHLPISILFRIRNLCNYYILQCLTIKTYLSTSIFLSSTIQMLGCQYSKCYCRCLPVIQGSLCAQCASFIMFKTYNSLCWTAYSMGINQDSEGLGTWGHTMCKWPIQELNLVLSEFETHFLSIASFLLNC